MMTVTDTLPVVPGTVKVGGFLTDVVARAGGNQKFAGSFSELEALVMEHFGNWVPGEGSKDGDVRIVQLPVDGFFTDIVEVTSENAHLLRLSFVARVSGEAPVLVASFPPEVPLVPATKVGIVIYHANVLAQDAGRSTDAEWEIVAVLADPADDIPMHPITMTRNANHEEGGTYREYSAESWLKAVTFWQNHAKIGDKLA